MPQGKLTFRKQLGKQDAFAAFVTITVNGSADKGMIHISAQSVNIKAAATTITISKLAQVRRKQATPWSNIFLGVALTGMGGLGIDRALKMEAIHEDRASRYYGQYRVTTDPEEASQLRRKVEFEDQTIARTHQAMVASGIISIIGIYNIFFATKDVIDFKLVSNSRRPGPAREYWSILQPAFWMSGKDLVFGAQINL
jgi:hypothetical protein